MMKEKKSKRDRSPSYDNERNDKRDSNRNKYADSSSRSRINDDKWIRNRDRSRDRSKSRDRYDDRSARSNQHKEEKRSKHSRSRSRSKERHRSDKEPDRKSSSKSSTASSSLSSSTSTKEPIIKQPQHPQPPIVLSAEDKEKLREAERAAEQEALGEEMRKRRERVKAWQDAKAAAAKSQPESSAASVSSVTSNIAKCNDGGHAKSESNESKQSVAFDIDRMDGDDDDDDDDIEKEEEVEEEEPKWTLEDENEEEGVDDMIGNNNNNNPINKGDGEAEEDDYLSYPLIGDTDLSTAGIAEHKHNNDEEDDEEEETAAVFSSAASKLKKASSSNVNVNVLSSSSSTPSKPSLKIERNISSKSINISTPPILTIPSLQVSIPQHQPQQQQPSSIITQQPQIKTSTTPPVIKQQEEEEEMEDPLDAFMKSLYTTSADLDKEDGVSTTATPTAVTLSGPATTATLSQKLTAVTSSSSSSSTSSSSSSANTAYRIDPFGSNFVTMEDLIKMGNSNNDNDNEYDDASSNNEESDYEYENNNNNNGIDKSSDEIMIQSNSMKQQQKSKKKKAKADSSNNNQKSVNEVIFRAGWESDLPSSPDHNTSDYDNERRTTHKTTTTTTTNINNTTDSSSSSITPSSSMLSAASMAAAQAQKLIDEEEEREEAERRMFIQALRQASANSTNTLGVSALAKSNLLAAAASNNNTATGVSTSFSSSSSLSSKAAKSTAIDGQTSSTSASATVTERSSTSMGRIFAGEGDMIEESEVEDKKKSALELLDEAKKGKELKPVDHSSIDYIAIRKNLYIVPKALARLSEQQIKEKREDLQIKVRGRQCPAPVDTWEQCGLSERALQVIKKQNLEAPFAIQKQAIPAIMCGRDVIAIAKTGSGKTLAFLLPLFRHIQDQPPLQPHLPNEGGPIGLILAPARELALQIAREAKRFGGAIGLSVACIYGGAGVADQIGELKRGADIVVCTPGRMIDILCMQAGKLVSLRRVSFVVMDEADRVLLSWSGSKQRKESCFDGG